MGVRSKNWFKILWKEYNQLCKELGVDNGACRSCVPVVKFDDKDVPDEVLKQEIVHKRSK